MNLDLKISDVIAIAFGVGLIILGQYTHEHALLVMGGIWIGASLWGLGYVSKQQREKP